jgi:uncharacterized RDD family membrane protein YckC
MSSRLLAVLADLPLIGGWVLFATVTGLIARATGFDFARPSAWDLFAFLTLIAPVTITFAALEASPRSATWGKRRNGLRVVDPNGGRLSYSRSFVRSVVKFAPWQIAHTGVFQITDGAEQVGVVLAIVAQGVVLCSVGLAWFDREHRALHDFVAGTRVLATAPSSGMVEGWSRWKAHRRFPTVNP